MTTNARRSTCLTTADLFDLDVACRLICEAFEGTPPYLVGSAMEKDAYRDVDVRLILSDGRFDALFEGRRALWELLSLTIGDYLRQRTGLPIDFQIQRQTEANAKHDKPRNPLGLSGRHGDPVRRLFAGGGDATPRWEDAG